MNLCEVLPCTDIDIFSGPTFSGSCPTTPSDEAPLQSDSRELSPATNTAVLTELAQGDDDRRNTVLQTTAMIEARSPTNSESSAMSIINGPLVPDYDSSRRQISPDRIPPMPSPSVPSNPSNFLTSLKRKHKALLTRISHLNIRMVNTEDRRRRFAFAKNTHGIERHKWRRRAWGLMSMERDNYRNGRRVATTPEWPFMVYLKRSEISQMRYERLAVLEERENDRVVNTHCKLLNAWDRLEKCELARQEQDPGPLEGEYWEQAKELHALEERRRKHWAETHAEAMETCPTVLGEEMERGELRRHLDFNDTGNDIGGGEEHPLTAAVLSAVDSVLEAMDEED